MGMYFVETRVYREVDGHYWTVGLRFEATDYTMASQMVAAVDYGMQVGSLGKLKLLTLSISSAGSGTYYHTMCNDPKQLIKEIRTFVEEVDAMGAKS